MANSTLWFVQHMLYATPTSPAFGTGFAGDWESFRAYNRAFAEALAEEAAPGARVLIQDYHLCLAPAMLRELRPDLRIAHFSHTPWAPPDYFRLLPDAVAAELLEGMLGADRAGFLTRRWAEAFADCCAAVLGATSTASGRSPRGRTPRRRARARGGRRRRCSSGPRSRTSAPRWRSCARRWARRQVHRAGGPHRAVEEHRARARGVRASCCARIRSGGAA